MTFNVVGRHKLERLAALATDEAAPSAPWATTLAELRRAFDESADMRDLADERQVYPWHAYVVKRVDAKAGVVELHNPWGSSHPSPLSVADFRKLYQWVYVGHPKAPKGTP